MRSSSSWRWRWLLHIVNFSIDKNNRRKPRRRIKCSGKHIWQRTTIYSFFAPQKLTHCHRKIFVVVKYWNLGREPWSSGYGSRLMFQRLWVWIPVPYSEWKFFSHLNVVKIMCVWKDDNTWKRGRGWPVFLKKILILKNSLSHFVTLASSCKTVAKGHCT